MTDKYIQALAGLECAYRALTEASGELPLGMGLTTEILDLRKRIRALEICMMNQAILENVMKGGAE